MVGWSSPPNKHLLAYLFPRPPSPASYQSNGGENQKTKSMKNLMGWDRGSLISGGVAQVMQRQSLVTSCRQTDGQPVFVQPQFGKTTLQRSCWAWWCGTSIGELVPTVLIVSPPWSLGGQGERQAALALRKQQLKPWCLISTGLGMNTKHSSIYGLPGRKLTPSQPEAVHKPTAVPSSPKRKQKKLAVNLSLKYFSAFIVTSLCLKVPKVKLSMLFHSYFLTTYKGHFSSFLGIL